MHGAFVWARGALNGRKRWFLARADDGGGGDGCGGGYDGGYGAHVNMQEMGGYGYGHGM